MPACKEREVWEDWMSRCIPQMRTQLPSAHTYTVNRLGYYESRAIPHPSKEKQCLAPHIKAGQYRTDMSKGLDGL